MMISKVVGSDLTRAMLMEGKQEVWCAISDDSDEQAMRDHYGNDFTAYIVLFYDGEFYCSNGRAWAFAVPIKIVALEANLIQDVVRPVHMAV